MNRKTFINVSLIVLVVVSAGIIGYFTLNDRNVPSADKYPDWVKGLIAEQENGPVANPAASLTQCKYRNQIAYYLPPRCCDIGSVLYDKNGNIICSPDGGFTGEGDGKCPDFFTARQNCKVIWKDNR